MPDSIWQDAEVIWQDAEVIWQDYLAPAAGASIDDGNPGLLLEVYNDFE